MVGQYYSTVFCFYFFSLSPLSLFVSFHSKETKWLNVCVCVCVWCKYKTIINCRLSEPLHWISLSIKTENSGSADQKMWLRGLRHIFINLLTPGAIFYDRQCGQVRNGPTNLDSGPVLWHGTTLDSFKVSMLLAQSSWPPITKSLNLKVWVLPLMISHCLS